MIKVVCFDLDGTLVDSEEVILKSFDYVFRKYNIKEAIEETLSDYQKYMGPPLIVTYKEFTNDMKLVNDMIEDFISYYKTIELGIIKLFDNVYNTLEYLYNKGINICLITNKFMSSSNPSLEFLDIKKFFNNFIALDRQERPKPDSFPIDLAIKDYKVNRDEVIMVGDNYVDMMCGKNAHVKTCLVSYNSWYLESLEASPDYVINDMSKLIKIIDNYNK